MKHSSSKELAAAAAALRVGNFGAAEAACRAVLAAAPDDADGQHLLGLSVLGLGRPDEAVGWLRRAAAAAPGHHSCHRDLAATLGRLGRHREAAAACRAVVTAEPSRAEAWHNLGLAHESLGELEAAADAYRRGIDVRPDWAVLHGRLGGVLRRLGRLTEAEAMFRAAVRGQPDSAPAWSGLALVLEQTARAAEAVECHRRIADLLPNVPAVGSNLLVALQYVEPAQERDAALHAEHVRWADRHARPLYPNRPPAFSNERSAARRLRVGYVSPDFRDHATPHFFEPLLAHHDPAAVEVFCYSDVPPARHDATKRRFQGYGHAWRDTAGMPDERVESVARADRIDVLVDLAGHMGNPRLTLFARRVAPVQVTYIGYPATTGLATMDYRMTDGLHDPPGESDRWHTERLVRLDPCCWAYRPDDEAPDVGALPALARNGQVTFAAFNRLAKASPRAIGLWARVLAAVPHARLMILVPAGAECDPALRATFARHGLGGERVVPVGQRPRGQYLRLWHEVDAALDSFPYHGMTTTCDGLWMGVPTVTLAGASHVSRIGVSLLAAVGLGELVAADDDGFVAVASRLAADLSHLAELRAGLRARVAGSPLCDGPGLARRVEAAYREMWGRWLAGRA